MASISSLRAGNGVRGPHTRVIWKGSDSKAPTRRVHCRQSVADFATTAGIVVAITGAASYYTASDVKSMLNKSTEDTENEIAKTFYWAITLNLLLSLIVIAGTLVCLAIWVAYL